MRFQIVRHVRADEHGLRRQVHLGLGGLVHALFLRLTNEKLARVQLVADCLAELWRIGLSLRHALLEHEIEECGRIKILALGRRVSPGGRFLRLLCRSDGRDEQQSDCCQRGE